MAEVMHFIEDPWFDTFIGVVIAFNSALIGYEAHIELVGEAPDFIAVRSDTHLAPQIECKGHFPTLQSTHIGKAVLYVFCGPLIRSIS